MSTGKMGTNGGGEDDRSSSLAEKSGRCRDGVRLFRYGRHARGLGMNLPNQRRRPEAEQELERARARVRAVTRRPLLTMRSEQFQAVGDAAEAFLKITLIDCENLADDFLGYYQGQGFDVKRSPRRLTSSYFVDERPYLEFGRKFAGGVSPFVWGFYSKAENWLVLFDFRNVPLNEQGAGHKNVKTLAHEGTHQLAFNTGLLNRHGDAPRAVVEGHRLVQ